MTRARYLALAVITVAVGLVVFKHGAGLGPVARDVTGDALWAAMMFWGISAVAPGARLLVRGMVALSVCFVVETSQRLHTPALDAIRTTMLGRLVLGTGFDPRDFASYAGGVLMAMLIAYAVDRRGPTN
jgi:Protein of unknown function (DUF2809)